MCAGLVSQFIDGAPNKKRVPVDRAHVDQEIANRGCNCEREIMHCMREPLNTVYCSKKMFTNYFGIIRK